MDGIIKKIKDRVGMTKPVYLSIDIDTLDPACKLKSFHFSLRDRHWKTPFLLHDSTMVLNCSQLTKYFTVAPATGTPETGGWSTRELRTIIRGLEGINFVAADIVEVAPAYDTNAEHTTMAAADTLYEVMTLMVKKGPLSAMVAQDEEL